jgi:hypothetical protein
MTRNKLSACVLSCMGGREEETYLYRAVLEVQHLTYSEFSNCVLQMEAGIFFKTSVSNRQYTWRHTLEDVGLTIIAVRT